MGKASLLLAATAVLCGSVILFNIQVVNQSSGQTQAQFQHDVLARGYARSAQQLMLRQFAGGTGLKSTTTEARTEPFGGGWIYTDADVDLATGTLTLTAEGRSGGPRSAEGRTKQAAVHRIMTTHQFVGFEVPAAIVLENTRTLFTPCVRNTSEGEKGCTGEPAEITHEGLKEAIWLNLVDAAYWNTLMGQGLFDAEAAKQELFAQLEQLDLAQDVAKVEKDLQQALETFYEESVRQRLSVGNFYELALDTHEKALGTGGSGYYPSAYTEEGGLSLLSGERRTYDEAIVRIKGDLALENGAVIEGSGVLIVEGDLHMQGGNQGSYLTWDGLVLVAPPGGAEHASAEAYLNGRFTLNGAIMTKHAVVPPGGHMDVTVWGAPHADWRLPFGTKETEGGMALGCGPKPGCAPREGGSYRPWWQHTPRYDLAVGSRAMPFIENGGAPGVPFGGRLMMDELLNELDPSNEYYLAFAPVAGGTLQNSGLARYTLAIGGAGAQEGNVVDGFEDGRFRSPPFEPDELGTFRVEVRTLQGLARLWNDAPQVCYDYPDSQECRDHAPNYQEGEDVTDYPVWVGNDYHREGAFRIQLRREEDDRMVYEAAAYWHREPSDELDADEEALKERLAENPDDFGFSLSLGKHALINYDRLEVLKAARLLGLAGTRDPYRLRDSYVQHWSAGDTPHVYD